MTSASPAQQPHSKSAAVYRFDAYLLIHAYAQTTAGISIADEPVVHLPAAASPAEIGQVLLDRLANARTQVPHPTDWPALQRRFLRAMDLKSSRELQRRARLCHVRYQQGTYTCMPTTSTKSEFRHEPAQILTCSGDDPERLGQAVLQALALSR